jgi:hypothetical protein
MKTLTFAVGLAAGYVLGARAGRERYEQIRDKVQTFADQPAVVRAQTRAKELLAQASPDPVDTPSATVIEYPGDQVGGSTGGSVASRSPRAPRKATSTVGGTTTA